jgi:hypothetical protein
MKDQKKFLHAAKKMEVRQVARKAGDIAEVYAFNLQLEHYRQDQFSQMLEDEDLLREAEQHAFEPFQEADEERVDNCNKELTSVETFEHEALKSQQYAEGNAFDTIAEMQGFDFEEQRPHAVKQLPAAPFDVFANSLTEITESHLEEEVTHNQQAITPWKEKVRTALIPQEKLPSKKQSRQDTVNEDTPELSEEQTQEALSREEPREAKSANSVFYFRPVNPKDP